MSATADHLRKGQPTSMDTLTSISVDGLQVFHGKCLPLCWSVLNWPTGTWAQFPAKVQSSLKYALILLLVVVAYTLHAPSLLARFPCTAA